MKQGLSKQNILPSFSQGHKCKGKHRHKSMSPYNLFETQTDGQRQLLSVVILTVLVLDWRSSMRYKWSMLSLPVLHRCPKTQALLRKVVRRRRTGNAAFPCGKSSVSARIPQDVYQRNTPLSRHRTLGILLPSCDALQDKKVEYLGLFSAYLRRSHAVRLQHSAQCGWSASFLYQKACFSEIFLRKKPAKNKSAMMRTGLLSSRQFFTNIKISPSHPYDNRRDFTGTLPVTHLFNVYAMLLNNSSKAALSQWYHCERINIGFYSCGFFVAELALWHCV